MKRTRTAGPGRPSGGDREATVTPLPRSFYVLALAMTAAVVVAGVTFLIGDPDIWQHLAAGRMLWQQHAIPATNVWTWPTAGAPCVMPSWLFRALLWPFWNLGGVLGLFTWRWLFALATFACTWQAARVMGARGLPALFAIAWCALLYRQRSQVRPESLVLLLLALQMLLLEWRRAGRANHCAWIVGLQVVWANAHLSWYLGPFVTTAYAVDAFARGGDERRAARGLLLIALASVAASLLHPQGWPALRQPFEFIRDRGEPIYRSISELGPIEWDFNLLNGLPAWLALVAIGALAQARRRPDIAQLLILGVFGTIALMSQRFLGYLAVAACAWFARDVEALNARVTGGGLRWSAPARLAVFVGMLAALAFCEIGLRPRPVPGVGFDWRDYPLRATDWIATHEVRGRSFNPFHFGGWLLWRFPDDRDRLPFMDIHQTGTREDRDLQTLAFTDPHAWRRLDTKYAFDWVLLRRPPPPGTLLLDVLDADPAFALVFVDDAAALYLRRDGRDSSLVAPYAYRWLPGGQARLNALGEAAYRDPSTARAVRAELNRSTSQSEWSSRSWMLLANLDLADRQWAAAIEKLERAARQNAMEPAIADRIRLARDSLAASRSR